jgi:hypothetical protein
MNMGEGTTHTEKAVWYTPYILVSASIALRISNNKVIQNITYQMMIKK